MSEVDHVSPSSATQVATNSLRRWLEYGAVTLFCLALFFGSFFLYTRHNDFSLYYHPDEWVKVEQIVDNKRDFKHPALMLEATGLALKCFYTKLSRHDVILTGRRVSAAFAALAVLALALASYRYGGLIGLVLSGITVGLSPSLLLYAHYMKEDTALLLGIALTLVAALIYGTVTSCRSNIVALFLLGLAAGVAASGKYIGVTALGAALILAAIKSPFTWRMPLWWIIVLFAFGVTVALINHRLFQSWATFKGALEFEAAHGVTEHMGLTMDRPNLFFAKGLLRETMPHVLLLAGIFLGSLIVFWKRIKAWELFLAFFAASFLLLLSYGVIPEYRYNLPVIVMLHLMAALAVVRLALLVAIPWRWIIVITALAVIIPLQLRRCLNYLDQFANDSRVRLHSFVAQNVPRGSLILADRYTALRFEDDPRTPERLRDLGIHVETKNWAADFGELQSLQVLGANYVAVSAKAYGRFFDPDIRPSVIDSRYQARRRFYEELFAKHELVWSSTPSVPTYSFVNPSLRLYRLHESSGGQTRE